MAASPKSHRVILSYAELTRLLCLYAVLGVDKALKTKCEQVYKAAKEGQIIEPTIDWASLYEAIG